MLERTRVTEMLMEIRHNRMWQPKPFRHISNVVVIPTILHSQRAKHTIKSFLEIKENDAA